MDITKSANDIIDNDVNMNEGENLGEVSPAPSHGIGINFDILKAKTGEGSIDDYIDHPLNFSQSRPLAQAIRGLTGLLGALDLAVIDIAMGILGYLKERGKNVA